MKRISNSDFIIVLVMLGLGVFLLIFCLRITSITSIPLLGILLIFGSMIYSRHVIKPIDENLSSYDYKTHGDFKKYYDTTQKRNYWVLGYFGGGSVNISEASILAKEYAKENNVPYNKVLIDEVLRSRRYKHFKFIYAVEEQKPDADADSYENVYDMLTD